MQIIKYNYFYLSLSLSLSLALSLSLCIYTLYILWRGGRITRQGELNKYPGGWIYSQVYGEEVMVSFVRCSGALPVCSGAWWIRCASRRAASVTRWCLQRKESSHVTSQAYRRSVSPRFRASHGLSGRGRTSLRCGRSRRDELMQVIRVRLQGNADECSGRSSPPPPPLMET